MEPGTILTFTRDWAFRDTDNRILSSYVEGDQVTLVKPTTQSEWGYVPGEGLSDSVFWVVETKHGTSTWTRLQRLMNVGVLAQKEN